jgi:hypothetical protein
MDATDTAVAVESWARSLLTPALSSLSGEGDGHWSFHTVLLFVEVSELDMWSADF